MATKTKTVSKPTVKTIDAETWAASGGTAGIFGTAWRRGLLKIVH